MVKIKYNFYILKINRNQHDVIDKHPQAAIVINYHSVFPAVLKCVYLNYSVGTAEKKSHSRGV